MRESEYRRTLKMPEAEEVFDLWIFRPAAWLVVRAIGKAPVTPDHLTYLSLACMLAAAWSIASGSLDGFIMGGFWYAAANVLDCADGQLARRRGGGSPHGRLIDGGADYIGSVAIFVAVGIGFSSIGIGAWLLVVASGLSSALHAMVFDNRQAAFIAARKGEPDPLPKEIAGVEKALAARPGPSPFLRFFLKMHLSYLVRQRQIAAFLQFGNDGGSRQDAGQDSGQEPGLDATLIRLWSYLGPTTNRTVFIASALIGRLDLFLWFTVVIANIWLVLMAVVERRASVGFEPSNASEE